ncbi:hypothetical protein L1O59_001689 [Salmonella enterica]|nr:hypothetical protein [Salmonella enterica]ECD6160922.1 hypothetical protein [Salmonella enterica subsp. enterica]ECU7992333.1 hypothetical protein [Salmonella enterica subsp. enterica serovar Toucra]EAW3060052.1 hypothetical protein [Salmonella enterica]EBN6860809.1 hypothetical protein [Salmonella enterica]
MSESAMIKNNSKKHKVKKRANPAASFIMMGLIMVAGSGRVCADTEAHFVSPDTGTPFTLPGKNVAIVVCPTFGGGNWGLHYTELTLQSDCQMNRCSGRLQGTNHQYFGSLSRASSAQKLYELGVKGYHFPKSINPEMVSNGEDMLIGNYMGNLEVISSDLGSQYTLPMQPGAHTVRLTASVDRMFSLAALVRMGCVIGTS